MWLSRKTDSNTSAASIKLLVLAGLVALFLTLPLSGWAQNDDSRPEVLSKQRTDLYLRATHAPLTGLENDVNHIAVSSENCRIKYGSAACGLPGKALESDKLEDRYAYYVSQPVEAHAKVRPVKIDRRNWSGSRAPAQP